MTRFAVLPDSRRLILGVDKNNVFEAGYIYEAREILDEIIITKVGKYSLHGPHHPNENSELNHIVTEGLHLVVFTEEELVAAAEQRNMVKR